MKVILVVLACFTISVSGKYDCRRDVSNLCKNGGTCNMATGACGSCDSGYEGYDCSVKTDEKAHADCVTNPCMNGGTCFKGPSTSDTLTCLCDEDFTGATCDTRRYQLTCNYAGDGNMDMTIIPYIDTFTGKVYVKDKADEASCTFAGDPPTLASLSNADSTCGATDNSANEKKRYVIVQYQSSTLTSQDELITFVCGPSDSIDIASPSFTVNAIDAAFLPITKSLAPLDADIDMDLLSSGSAVGTITMGTLITASIDLTAAGHTKFGGYHVEQCIAASHASNTAPGYEELKFIDGGCPHSDLSNVMVPTLTSTGSAVEFSFYAFKFADVGTVFVTCTIKTCEEASDCSPTSCDGGSTNTGYGRKKRSAGTVEKILQRSFNISDPLAVVAAAASLQTFKESKACYQTWEMTATVVALAVSLVIVLLVCIILIIKTILNKRGSATYREDVSETSSTARFPNLPTMVSNKC